METVPVYVTAPPFTSFSGKYMVQSCYKLIRTNLHRKWGLDHAAKSCWSAQDAQRSKPEHC